MQPRATRENAEPIDARVRLLTPERIDFEYPLGGPFRRFTAYLIDLALIFILVLTGFIASQFLALGSSSGMGLALVVTS